MSVSWNANRQHLFVGFCRFFCRFLSLQKPTELFSETEKIFFSFCRFLSFFVIEPFFVNKKNYENRQKLEVVSSEESDDFRQNQNIKYSDRKFCSAQQFEGKL
jgi:hypothetical protein